MKKWEICNVCEICGNWFVCKHRDVKHCSLRCWRKSLSPEERKRRNKYKSSPEAKARKLIYWKSSAGRAGFRKVANRIELRKALKYFGETFNINETDLKTSYLKLVASVNKNRKLAKDVIKGGAPDARNSFVEFKFGIDSLRADQLILDILIGRKGKVRWIPSYDDLEKTLRGRKNRSVLFDSYLTYLTSCEKSKNFDLKVSA